MNEHQWSGWPGAFCLKCGAEDLNELALADNCSDCIIEQGKELSLCEKHRNRGCPSPDGLIIPLVKDLTMLKGINMTPQEVLEEWENDIVGDDDNPDYCDLDLVKRAMAVGRQQGIEEAALRIEKLNLEAFASMSVKHIHRNLMQFPGLIRDLARSK